MVGLNTSTRLRAIIARRRRRISSSLLPENIGPQITSIQPTLPVTMSIGIAQDDIVQGSLPSCRVSLPDAQGQGHGFGGEARGDGIERIHVERPQDVVTGEVLQV